MGCDDDAVFNSVSIHLCSLQTCCSIGVSLLFLNTLGVIIKRRAADRLRPVVYTQSRYMDIEPARCWSYHLQLIRNV